MAVPWQDPFTPRDDLAFDWSPGDDTGSLTIDITHSDAEGFYLGLAETSAGGAGWYGEDCRDNLCHHFTAMSGSLAYVHTTFDMEPGVTTLFNNGTNGAGDVFAEDGSDRLTYLVQLAGGPYDAFCYVWGDDPSYYDSYGCEDFN